MCRNFTTSEASEELCQCQTAGDRLRGGTSLVRTDTHTHKHTLSLTYTVSMGNLGAERTVGLYGASDRTIPVSDMSGWL